MKTPSLLTRALNGYSSVARKELLFIQRDITTLIFALLIPVIQLILFGFAIDYDVRHVRTVVVDMDRSRESREYLASLENTGYIDIIRYERAPSGALEDLRRGDARVAVVVPPDFARRRGTRGNPTVEVLLDGSDSQVASPARRAFERPPPSLPPGAIETRIRVLYNPDMRTQVYTIPGLAGIILQLVTVALTSFSLVREREQGTLEQLMVSPVGSLGLLLGKLTPYAVLGMIELITILFAGDLIFDVRIAGSLMLLLVLAVPFLIAALSMGLLISTLARTQGQALLMTLLTVLPSVLLSGYIAPRDTLPGILYILSDLFPVTYFIEIMRGIVVRGTGLYDLLTSVLSLIALSAALLALSAIRFRKSLV